MSKSSTLIALVSGRRSSVGLRSSGKTPLIHLRASLTGTPTSSARRASRSRSQRVSRVTGDKSLQSATWRTSWRTRNRASQVWASRVSRVEGADSEDAKKPGLKPVNPARVKKLADEIEQCWNVTFRKMIEFEKESGNSLGLVNLSEQYNKILEEIKAINKNLQ